MLDRLYQPNELFVNFINTVRVNNPKEIAIRFLPELDEILWGLSRQAVYTIAARTSQGKSAFMLNLAWDAALQGKKVYIFSLEMTPQQCIKRLFCIDQDLPNEIFREPTLLKTNKIDAKCCEFHLKLKNSRLIVIDSLGKSFTEIEKFVESLGAPDIVCLDYIQAIARLNREKMDDINEYLRLFREYAIEKKFVGILCSQINRDIKTTRDRRPQLWQLKSSGFIEEHSDVVLLLHWPYCYNLKQEHKDEFEVRVAKNRDGAVGLVKCRFYANKFKFEEWI